MTSRASRNPPSEITSNWFSLALVISVIAGILLAWSPRFWSVAAMLTGISLLSTVWILQAKRFLFPRQAYPLVFVAAWGWIQMLLGWTVAPYITIIEALKWTGGATAFLLSCQLLFSSRLRSSFLSILTIGTAAFSVLAVLQAYTNPEQVLWIFPAEPRSFGTFLYKNQFAAMLELTAPVALYWTFFTNTKRWQGLLVFSLLFGGALVSASRAGAILIVVELFAVAFVAWNKDRIKGKQLLSLLLGTLLCVAAISWLFGSERMAQRLEEVNTYKVRSELLKSTIAMWKIHPVTGSGLGTWSMTYPSFSTFDLGVFANAAHNDWAEWCEEGGLVFLLAITTFFATLVGPAVRSVWGLGVLAIMFHSWVDYPLREPAILILWFCIAGAVVTAAEASYQRQTRTNREAL